MSTSAQSVDAWDTIPELGVLLGHLAKALRVHGDLLDPGAEVSPKTAARWFSGHRIDHDARERIVETFLDNWLPASNDMQMLRDALRDMGRRWESEAASLSSSAIPAPPLLVTLGLTRLALLDLAVRYGAARLVLPDRGVGLPPAPYGPRVFGDQLRRFQEQRAWSVEVLAEKVGVHLTTVERWRSGAQLPGESSFAALLRVLKLSSNSPERTNLRLALGLASMSHQLTSLFGNFFDIFVPTLNGLVVAVEEELRDASPDVQVAFLVRGARADVMATENLMPRLVARIEPVPPFAQQAMVDDCTALPRAWAPRAAYWGDLTHAPPTDLPELARVLVAFGLEPRHAVQPGVLQEIQHTTCALFWTAPIYFREGARSSWAPRPAPTPLAAAVRLCVQGKRQWAEGEHLQAIQSFQGATELAPDFSMVHYALGMHLGLALVARPDLEDFEQLLMVATSALRDAQRLAPSEPPFRLGPAALLTACRYFAEAELEYEHAKSTCADDADHHYARGRNYLGLGDERRALACFERVVELKPDHVGAKGHLCVLYVRVAPIKRRLSNTYAHWLRQRVGKDPRDQPDLWLDPVAALPISPGQ